MNVPSSPLRNVENIRRLNLQDNQIFLQNLRLKDVQDDFIDSARSFLRANRNQQTPKKSTESTIRFEYMTRYQKKVQNGEIVPHTPEWKRSLDAKNKKTEEEENLSPEELKLFRRQRRLEEQAKMRLYKRLAEERYRWKLFFMNRNPYERIFKPRSASIDKRIRKERVFEFV